MSFDGSTNSMATATDTDTTMNTTALIDIPEAVPVQATEENLLVSTVGTSNPDRILPSSPVLDAISPNAGIEVVKGIEMTSLGLKVAEGVTITPAQFNTLLCSVTALSRASNWLLGDTLDIADRAWGNQHTGSKYEELSKETWMAVSTIKNIVSVCHRIPYDERHPNLSFSHHLEALSRTDNFSERESMLERAEAERMPIKKFRSELMERQAITRKDEEPMRDLVGELCTPESMEAVKFPMSYEFFKFDNWLHTQNFWKLDDDVRRRVVNAAIPLMTRLYTLIQLELEENPDTTFDLPFEVKPGDFDINQPL